MFDLARERFARVAGADDDHARRRHVDAVAPAQMILADANNHAQSEQRQQRERPVGHDRATRRVNEANRNAEFSAEVVAGGENCSGGGETGDQADDIGDSDVAPPSAIKTEEDADK